MTDILDLQGWNALGARLDGNEYEIEAEYTVSPDACQKCGVVGNLYRHGPKPITIRDSPIRGRPVRILAKAQRFKCRDCGGTFIQPLGGIHAEMRMTTRCVDYIESQCLRDTFVRVAEHIGCDDKTVRNVAGDYIDRLNAEYKPYLPDWLGIDETQIDGQLRCIITDVANRTPVDMLPDRDKRLVTSWLHQFKDRTNVKGLAIDMWRPYKDAAQSVFPGLPVVIDKFHVVKMANKALEDVRIMLAKDQDKAVGKDWMRRKALLRMRYKNLDEKGRFNLQMWLDNEPDIATAYRLKESFYDIYDAPNFKPLLTATRNWRHEILAYFDYPISNGYTEALNGVAKVINRSGRGYSFDVLRARLLFKTPRTPPPEEWRIVTAYPANDVARSVLFRKHSMRCESCQGVFGEGELHASHVVAVVKGEHRKRGLICQSCFDRFHTAMLDAKKARSTQ